MSKVFGHVAIAAEDPSLDAVAALPGTARRADARRNIEAILGAAGRLLSRDPDATLNAIAEAAGVGRITLYGHFPSRAGLVEAVVMRELEAGEKVLRAVDLDGDPRQAVARLLACSWRQVERLRSVMSAAEAVLPPERMLQLHAGPAARVEALIDQGRAGGLFRTDVPSTWLVNTLHRVLHGAADELHAGRLDEAEAVRTIVGTVLAAFTAPGGIVPSPDALLA